MSERLAARREATAWFGAVLGLGAVAMLFAALLFAVAYTRARSGTWPPPGIAQLSWHLPAAALAAALLASAALAVAGTGRRGLGWVGQALGAAALGVELSWLIGLSAEGIPLTGSGAFGPLVHLLIATQLVLASVAWVGLLVSGLRKSAESHARWTLVWQVASFSLALVLLAVVA